MAKKYQTVSLPIAVVDDIKELIDEVGHWPSVSAFTREACLVKIREEKRRLQEAKGETINARNRSEPRGETGKLRGKQNETC